jgi:hypothetical protein
MMNARILAAAIGFCALALCLFTALPDAARSAILQGGKVTLEDIEEMIDNDPGMGTVSLEGFTQTIRGATTSPESLKRLRAAFEAAKPHYERLTFTAILFPGWTPHVVSGTVVGEDGKPSAKEWIEMQVLKYVAPEGYAVYSPNVPVAENRRYMMLTDEGGFFEFKMIPTDFNEDVLLTVRDPYPRVTTLRVPVGSRDTTLKIGSIQTTEMQAQLSD